MLNARRSLDPRWITNHRRAAEGFMISTIEIYKQSASLPTWNPDTNDLSDDGIEVVWSGYARIQDNKDWRARDVASAGDPQMLQYVRFQIPLNKSGPVPHIPPGYLIRVLDVDAESSWFLDPDLSNWTFRVRNTVNSSYPWLRNILCIVDLSEQPYQGGAS